MIMEHYSSEAGSKFGALSIAILLNILDCIEHFRLHLAMCESCHSLPNPRESQMMIIELLLHGQGNQFKILELSLHAEGNRAMKYSSFLQNLASFKLIIWKTLFCKSLLS
jgi:hypothetical protein